MSVFSVSERFVDSVGPIVVKEVRQGLRAKVFAICFGSLLVVCLSMALVAVAQASEEAGDAFGKKFLGGYLNALGAVTFFVIPFVAFRSMMRELEDETWVLLTLTGLGATSIIRGKWVCAMSQALLFGSACAPFVLFCYFLDGVDIVQVVTALVLTAGWSALLTSVGVAVATQARSKLGRTFAHFVVLGLLGAGPMAGITCAWVIAERFNRVFTNDFGNLAIGGGLFSWALTWLMLESAAAGLALPSEAASRGPRIAYVVIGLLALAFGLVTFVLTKGRPPNAVAGQVLTSFFFTIAGAFCISEADGWPRQAAAGFWLKPGGARSFWLALLLLLLSALMWGLLISGHTETDSIERALRGTLAAFAFPSLYLSLGVLLGRLTPLRHLAEPVATRVGFMLSIVVGVVGSIALSLAFDGRPAGKVMNVLNPLVGLLHFIDGSGAELNSGLVLLGALTAMAVFLASVVLHERDQVRSS